MLIRVILCSGFIRL